MFSAHPCELSFDSPLHAVDAVRAEASDSMFITATCNPNGADNFVHLVRFQSDIDQLTHVASLSSISPDQQDFDDGGVNNAGIQKIVTSPNDRSLFLSLSRPDPRSASTAASAGAASVASLCRIPQDVFDRTSIDDAEAYGSEDNFIEQIANLTPTSTDGTSNSASNDAAQISDICWRGSEEEASISGDVISLSASGMLTQWDLSMGTAEQSRTMSIDLAAKATPAAARSDACALYYPSKLAWDPHNCDAMAVSRGSSIHMLDWRSPESSSTIFKSHRGGVTGLDFNPNKPNVLATSGMDGFVKFWDTRYASSSVQANSNSNTNSNNRKLQRPLFMARGGHRHWSSCVKYNPSHDQLVLSAGTDAIVNLWRVSTISSAPLLALNTPTNASTMAGASGATNDDDNSDASGPNVRVGYHEHMDSIYSVAWGHCDPWMFASVGLDGKLYVHHVPSKEKYKILL